MPPPDQPTAQRRNPFIAMAVQSNTAPVQTSRQVVQRQSCQSRLRVCQRIPSRFNNQPQAASRQEMLPMELTGPLPYAREEATVRNEKLPQCASSHLVKLLLPSAIRIPMVQ